MHRLVYMNNITVPASALQKLLDDHDALKRNVVFMERELVMANATIRKLQHDLDVAETLTSRYGNALILGLTQTDVDKDKFAQTHTTILQG